MGEPVLPPLSAVRGPSVADLVADALYRRVVQLDLRPGTKLSELEVARQAGVSRQPVRDAFWRLSELGLLTIQPQRATTVSRISEEAVRQARFIRTAIETETTRAAALAMTPDHLDRLRALIAAQDDAVRAGNRSVFHDLDDTFHRAICAVSGNEFAWTLIRNHKGHMDRVRFLSLRAEAGVAFGDHAAILAAFEAGDADAAVATMRLHLSRITAIVASLRIEQPELFAGPPA